MSIRALPRGRSGRSALEVATDAARHAGGAAMGFFLGEFSARYKGTGTAANIVTQADLAAEQAALSIIADEYPTHTLLSEEAGEVDRRSPFTWILDPLDGTLNYSYGLDIFATSIALLHRGEPVVGVVYAPSRDEVFAAEKGKGATLNGIPIAVSAKDSLAASLAGFDLGYDEEMRKKTFEYAGMVRPHVQGLRIVGSAALSLAYVACARFDLYFHRSLYPWDVAAAILLVHEAGGVVTDWNGKPAAVTDRMFVAGPAPLHRAFLEIVVPS